MKSSFLTSAFLLLGLVFCSPDLSLAKTTKLSPADQAKVDDLLSRLDKAQQSIRTLKAQVRETRQLALLNDAEVLTGELTFERPEKFRWDYLQPERSSYVLADGMLTGWRPDENQVERVDVSKREKRLRRLVAIGQDSESLQRSFRIQPAGDDALTLTPKSRRVRKHLKRVELTIDDAGLPSKVVYITGAGDEVTLELLDIALNPDLPSRAFALSIPADAQVVKGLSLGFMGSNGVEKN